jgi:glycosyltransferase involved in cell wall biosynthesis
MCPWTSLPRVVWTCGLFCTAARNTAVARNIAIAPGTGDWLAFLNADDIWHQSHLERAAELQGIGEPVGLLAHHVSCLAYIHEALPHSLRCRLTVSDSTLPGSYFTDLMRAAFNCGHSSEVLSRPGFKNSMASIKAGLVGTMWSCGYGPLPGHLGLGHGRPCVVSNRQSKQYCQGGD